ncbi:hypothetical protein [Geodermatophilus sp. SYSU D00815]
MNRSVPVHPVVPSLAATLAAAVALLQTTGLAVRLFEVRGRLGHLLAMDAPGSLARWLVVAVLGAAVLAAVLGVATQPARRRWWTAAAAVLAVLAGAQLAGNLRLQLPAVLGLLVVAGAALVWGLGRGRDRNRLVAVLGAHVLAAVGLSAIASYARATGGPVSAAFATFVEESGEALTAVGLLVAVLVALLPRRPARPGTPDVRTAASVRMAPPVAVGSGA